MRQFFTTFTIREFLGMSLLALALAPATADPGKHKGGKGREGAKEFWKQQEKSRERQEKAFEKRRKDEEKAWEERRKEEERYRERVEKHREGERHAYEGYARPANHYGGAADRWAGPPYVLAPPRRHGYDAGYHYDAVYGRRSAYGGYSSYADGYGYDSYSGGYSAYAPSYVVPQAAPDDDIDAAYTPYGYFEKYPEPGYDAYGPRPYGHGQIGPYRFEVHKGD